MARAHGCPRPGTEVCRDSSLTSCAFTVLAGHPGCPLQHHDGELWEWDVWYLGVWCSGKGASFSSAQRVRCSFMLQPLKGEGTHLSHLESLESCGVNQRGTPKEHKDRFDCETIVILIPLWGWRDPNLALVAGTFPAYCLKSQRESPGWLSSCHPWACFGYVDRSLSLD